MPKTARFTECIEWIDLRFVGRERTPREIINMGIRHHLAAPTAAEFVLSRLARLRIGIT
jgi:putative transposase